MDLVEHHDYDILSHCLKDTERKEIHVVAVCCDLDSKELLKKSLYLGQLYHDISLSLCHWTFIKLKTTAERLVITDKDERKLVSWV